MRNTFNENKAGHKKDEWLNLIHFNPLLRNYEVRLLQNCTTYVPIPMELGKISLKCVQVWLFLKVSCVKSYCTIFFFFNFILFRFPQASISVSVINKNSTTTWYLLLSYPAYRITGRKYLVRFTITIFIILALTRLYSKRLDSIDRRS